MKHLILLVGLPGSGKSTYCSKYPSYLRISQDDQGKEGCKRLYEVGLKEGVDIIVDRCNFNKVQRNKFIPAAKAAGYRITIVHFQVSASECIDRIGNRHNHPNLTASSGKAREVVTMFANMFEAPTEDEADEVIRL